MRSPQQKVIPTVRSYFASASYLCHQVPETFQSPLCDDKLPETLVQQIARSVAAMPKDKVFARWYDDKGEVESTRTFHGVWEGSGEVSC